MRRGRIMTVLLVAVVALLVLAPSALAEAHGGEGWYGETSDKTITYAMYVVIIFFPLTIVLLSLFQGWRERRQHHKLNAAKRRAANVDWRGGW